MTPDGSPSFISEWKAIRRLGNGQFGSVYEIQKNSGSIGTQHSALKIIEIDRKHIKKFKDEITALQAIRNSPHSVTIEDFSEITVQEDGYDTSYLVIRMELLKPLHSEGMSEDEVIQLALDIGDILSKCHQARPKILHRDIKPANILMTENSVYKLSDFGEAKFLDKSKGNTDSAEHGTPFYMAPEIVTYS